MDNDESNENRKNEDTEPQQEETQSIDTYRQDDDVGERQEEATEIQSIPGSTPGTPYSKRSSGFTPSQRSQSGSVRGTPSIARSNRSLAPSIAGTPYRSQNSQSYGGRTPMSAAGGGGTLPRGDMGHSNTYTLAAPQRTPHVPPTPLTPMSQIGLSPPGSVAHSYRSVDSRGGLDRDGDRDRDRERYRELAERDDRTQQQLEGTLIWGTSIVVQDCVNVFRNFIENFELPIDERDGGQEDNLIDMAYYQHQLHVMHRTGGTLLNLDCAHLLQYRFTRTFYDQLREYPQEIIPIMDRVIQEEYANAYGEAGSRLQVRTYGLREHSRMRLLDPQHIDQLLTLKGMVIRCSSVIPDLKQAFFRCFVCACTMEVLIDRGRIEEPSSCPDCQKLASMELIHNRSCFTDKQLVRLQETNEEIPEGETPYTVTLFAYDDLVDSLRPGDRVHVTGIFRAIPRRINPRMRSVQNIYKTYVDAIHFKREDQGIERSSIADINERLIAANRLVRGISINNGLHRGPEDENITLIPNRGFSNKQLRTFRNIVLGGNVYDRLTRSFAPSIYGMDDVKRGLLCLLFGGTIRNGELDLPAPVDDDQLFQQDAVEQKKKITVHQRGDINVLLCGDPGTSKSQLLSYVHKISPRGIYTSGKGSSAVGLTASVVRDPETKDMVLESGALVLSDNGICCIDEFDKMSDMTRAILHEAMEQQTVSITKAGIIATLNARTSILASANPRESRYNPRMSVVDNIDLPPTLLSRFDLIYLVLDKPNQDADRRLANHIVGLYQFTNLDETDKEESKREEDLEDDDEDAAPEILSQALLRDFLLYARHHVCPEIGSDAETLLVQSYLEMRSYSGKGKSISATPRQLESLIRLSQALAKMRLSMLVTAEDVIEATRLMKVATQTAALDPRTGTIDMDMITTGKSTLDHTRVTQLADEIRASFCITRGTRMTVGQIRQSMNNREHQDFSAKISMAHVEDAVRHLESENVIKYVDRTQTIIVN